MDLANILNEVEKEDNLLEQLPLIEQNVQRCLGIV